MDQFLKNATVVRVVDGRRVDVGPIARSKFSEHVNQRDSFGNVPKKRSAASTTLAHLACNASPPAGVASKRRRVASSAGAMRSNGGESLSAASSMSSAIATGRIEHATTVDEVLAIRAKEVEAYDASVRALRQKLFDVDEELLSTPRTRRNVVVRKRLIERRDALRAELARTASSPVSTMTMLVQDTLNFYDERERRAAKRKAVSADATATTDNADALKRLRTSGAFAGGGNDASALRADAAHTGVGGVGGGIDAKMAIQFGNASVPRIAEVTFGAPLIEGHEYARLESMLRAQMEDGSMQASVAPVARTTTTTTVHAAAAAHASAAAVAAGGGGGGGGNGEITDTERFERENALADIDHAFDAAVRADVASHAMQEVQIVAFFVSPATRGWNAVDEAAADDEAAVANESAMKAARDLLGRTTASSASGGTGEHRALEMITIGANRTQAVTGSKIRNRLNIKNKEIRNMENVSMLNFCRVQKHKPSDHERETVEFVRHMGARHVADTTADDDVNFDDIACENCNAPLDINMRTGMETCHKCGLSVYGGTGREMIPLEQQMHNKYQYLKVGHMKTILKRSQGKETTRIPQKVPNEVTRQLKMERANFDTVDAFHVKKTLKKLGYSKWYDHMHQITHIVTGRQPHQFTAFEEEVILSVFEHLVEPYEKYRPKNQENFPYYYYALHKICQLLQYPPEVLRNFPLLQNVQKHRSKEKIWRNMMHDLGWPYYPSS